MLKRGGRTAVVMLSILLAGCTLPQVMIGQLYRIQTPASGACPGLVWQFVVDAQREIAGSLGRDGQLPFADLSGVLHTDESFVMTVTDHDSGRTAQATGQFTAQISTIAIQGDGAGAACDGQSFSLRLGGYFARQGGGGGGGG